MDLPQLPISEEGSLLNTGDLPDRMGVIRFANPRVLWRATRNMCFGCYTAITKAT